MLICWMDYPAIVRRASGVAVVAIFSALTVGSDFALAPFANVKLMDTIVFVVAFVYGFRKGAAVAVISETVWSLVSPWGMAGAITPFLVGGELLFALAGWWSSRVWGGRSRLLTPRSLFVAALMLICAFVWDFETNAATALIAYWPTLTVGNLSLTEIYGIPFALVHEEADFLLGLLVAPAAILMIPRIGKVGG
jgi:riboflavin transporter FmnP